MSVLVKCPSCSQKLELKERMLGRTITCPACKSQFVADGQPSAAATSQSSGNVASSAPGQIGRFKVISALGQGGFGAVFRAHDPVLNREVALKTPKPGMHGAERLVLEAQSAARLRHPHIVAVFEAGVDGDTVFIVSEFVEGQTLEDRRQQSAVEQRTAVEWAKSLAEALAYAHAEGVVHRDVKPQNVMLDKSGRAQLMDFGLAQSTGSQDAAGGVVGTPAYMSPEQARGESGNINTASDQWSVGAVLYELLTGRPPFGTGPDALSRIKSDEVAAPLRSVKPGMPRDLEAICLKSLSKKPEERYAGCGELADDLGRWLNDELVSAYRYSPLELAKRFARKRPALFGWTTAAVAVSALLLGSGAAYGVHVLTSQVDGSPSALEIEEPDDTPDAPTIPAVLSGSDRNHSISEAEMLLYGRLLDRTRCAFSHQDVVTADHWLEQTRWDLREWEYNYLRRIVTGGWMTLEGNGTEVTAIAIHPAGTEFAVSTLDGTVQIYDVCSGEALRGIQSYHPVTSLAYSPDGATLAVATGLAGEQSSQNPMFCTPASGIPFVEAPSRPGQVEVPPGPPTDAPPPPSDAPPPPSDSPPPPVEESVPPAPPEFSMPGSAPEYGVVLLDSSTLGVQRTYREHTGPVSSIAFSSDGALLASAGTAPAEGGAEGTPVGTQPAGMVLVWDPITLDTRHELVGYGQPMRRVVFAGDGLHVAATSGAGPWGAVLVWNLDPHAAATQQPIAAPPPPGEPETPAPIEGELPPASGQLYPEYSYSGGHFALGAYPEQYGQLVAAPALDVQFLERGRRRTSGGGDLHRWWMGPDAQAEGLSGFPEVVYDLAICGEPGQYGQYPLAAAGGDALLRTLPGIVTLQDPSYQPGAVVPHLGHTTAVTAVAFRPDGKQFITGSVDGTIKIWNAEVHPEVVSVGRLPTATRVAFGRDGRYVAVAGGSHSWTDDRGAVAMWDDQGQPIAPAMEQGIIKICDIETGDDLLALTGGPGRVLGLVMDPDMKWVAAGGEDAQVRVWNLETSEVQHLFDVPGIVRDLAVSTDGQFLAAACGGAASAGGSEPTMAPPAPLQADAETGDESDLRYVSYQPEAPAPPAEFVPITPTPPAEGPTEGPLPSTGGGHGRATSSSSGFIVIWRISDGEEVANWQAHDEAALSVTFSPDGEQIVSSSADRTVRHWNIAEQNLLDELDAFDGEIVDIAFRPTGEEIAGVGYDPCRPDQPGDVVIWNASTGDERLRLRATSGWMFGITYSPDGKRLATGGGSYEGSLSHPGEVTIWDADTGIELLPLSAGSGRDEKTEQFAETYVVKVPVVVTKTVSYPVTVCRPELNENGETVMITETEMREQAVYEVQYQEEHRTRMSSHHVSWEEPGTIVGIAFSGDGRSLAAACENGIGYVWDAQNCQPHDTVRWRNGRLACVATSPDGSLIATAGDSGDHCEPVGLIRVYDAVTGRMTQEIETTAGSVVDIAFTDNTHVVTVGGRGAWQPPMSCTATCEIAPLRPEVYQLFFQVQSTVDRSGAAEVWDVVAGERLHQLNGHGETVASVAVHPDDGRILTGGHDGSVRLWDADSGEVLHEWTGLEYVTAVAFADDGTQFAVVSGESHVWLGDPESDTDLKLVSDQVNGLSDIAFDSAEHRLIGMATTSWGQAAPVAMPVSSSEVVAVQQPAFTAVPKTASEIYFWDLDDIESRETQTVALIGSSLDIEDETGWLVLGEWSHNVTLFNLATNQVQMRLTGHHSVTRAAALPDGRVVSVSEDYQLKVWRLPEILGHDEPCNACIPSRLRTIELNSSPMDYVHDVRFSGDGTLAAVAGHLMRQRIAIEYPVRIVDAATGESQFDGGHYDTVRAVDVRADGQQWASVGQDQNLFFWNTNGTSLPTPPHANKIMNVVYSRDGNRAATATAFDGMALIWDTQTAQLILQFQVEPETAFALDFNLDGTQLVTAGLSGAIKVWNVATGESLREWAGHEGTIQSVQFSRDGTRLISCGHDQTAKLWNFETGELIHTFEGFGGPVWDADFGANDEFVAVGSHEDVARVFHAETFEIVKELPGHGAGVWSLEFTPDGSRLACCGRESPLIIWDWSAATQVATNPEAGECLAWFPSGDRLVTGSVFNLAPTEPEYDAIITLHDSLTGRRVDTVTIPDAPRPEFDLSRDGSRLVVGRPDGVAVIWDRRQQKVVAECAGHTGPITGVAFHPGDELFATVGQDGTARVWMTDGSEAFSFTHSTALNCVEFSPDGSNLAAGDLNKTVQLWDIDRQAPLRTFEDHYGELCCLAFSGDGRFLASSSRASGESPSGWIGDLKVWNVSTGEMTLNIPSHTWWDAGIAFHPRRAQIASTGQDHTMQLFDAETGALLMSWPTNGYGCYTMAFSPDGSRLLVPLGPTAKLIDPTPEERPFGGAAVVPQTSPSPYSPQAPAPAEAPPVPITQVPDSV